MEKPPVLNEEQVIKWIKDNYGENAIIAPLAHGKTAQRDADVEFCDLLRNKEADQCTQAIADARQQARQDTAREIIGKLLREGANKTFAGEEWWCKLKSRFPIPPNPVGSADV